MTEEKDLDKTIETEQSKTNPTRIVLMQHSIKYEDKKSVIPQNVREYVLEQDPDVLTVDGLNTHLLHSVQRFEEQKRLNPEMEITPDIPSREWIDSIAAIRPNELRENQTLVLADFPAEIEYLMFTIEGYRNIDSNMLGDGEITVSKAVRPLLNALSTTTAYSLLLPAAYLINKKINTKDDNKDGVGFNKEISRREFLKGSAVGALSIMLGRFLIEKQPSLDLVKILHKADFFNLQDAWLDLRNIKMRLANQQELEEVQKSKPEAKSIVLLGTAHAHTLDPNVNDNDYDIESFKFESRTEMAYCFMYMKNKLQEAGIKLNEPVRTMIKRIYSEYSTIKRDSNGNLIEVDTSIKDIDLLIDSFFIEKESL